MNRMEASRALRVGYLPLSAVLAIKDDLFVFVSKISQKKKDDCAQD